MKIILESTTDIRIVAGIQMRVWQGQSEDGVKCWALIPIIATRNSDEETAFDRELQDTKASVSFETVHPFPKGMVLA